MEEKDKLRSFYDNVSSYLDIGSYGDFYGAMQDPSRRQKFFDSTSQYVDIGDSDKFNQFVGDYFGQQQPAQRVDVSDVEQAEQPQIPTVTMEQVENEPASPYGDLTAENFIAAQQRGKELSEQRKRIQSALDSDTEMEPLTASQRKEYESQLRGLDEEMRGVSSWIDEWNKTEGARAYYEQQKRAVDDVSARIDQMQADRNRERISKRVEEDNKKSWWQRMAEGLASAESPITEEVVEAITDTDNNDLRAARNEVRNAKNQLRLEEMRQNGEQRGLGFVRGLETSNYYELMPAVGMADAMSILQLSKDIKDGKELTDSQKLLKEAMEARAGVDFAYQDNNTLWERIGQSAPEQLMFTAQFVLGAGLTGATEMGERAAAKQAEKYVARYANNLWKKVGEQGIKEASRYAERAGAGSLRGFIGTRALPLLEGMGVSSAIQTAVNPTSIVEDFEKRYAGDIYYDKDGNLHVFDNDRSAGQAAYQAIASAWIENFTEYAGANITKSAKLLDSKMFDLAGKFDNVMKTVGAGKIQDVFRIPQQLGRLTQIGSAPEEFLEEELGSVMNALMATDAQRGESYGDAFKNTISSSFAGEQQLETFLSCAITSMLLGGGGNAVNGVRNAGLRKSVNQDVEQSKALLGNVRGVDIEGLDNMIENGRVSDISAYLKEQSDANNWNKDEQGAAVSYVLNRSRQIGVKHNDDTAIEAEQAEYRRQAEDMVNRWDGQNIYNVTYTDRNGENQEGTIVNGRVHYNTNEDGTYTFDPYMSSGMLAIRRADGSVEQVAGRNVTALNNVATIEEQLESQNQTIDQLMRAEFDQDGMLPTIESVWGGNLVPNVTQFQNGRYTYLGQDDNGLYAFANNDKRTSKDNPIVYLTERQLIEYGLSLNLENAQANGDTEAAQKAQDDIDFLKRLDEITADAGAKGQWDVVKAYAQKNVQLDANGDIIPDGSNEQATAAYLLAISEGSFENAIASVDQTIAALGTPQQTEVTDNAADNAAMNNAAATVDADKARQIDFYTNVRNRLTEMQQGKEEADQEEAEQVVANTPVSQMEVGQQFPVEWRGQQAMATVMGKDADGRSVVTVRDMNGEDIEAGIDDMSDADWEAVRVQPQEATAPEQVPPQAAPQAPEQVEPQQEVPQAAPQSEPQPQQEAQQEPRLPMDKDGNIDYEQIADPALYAQGLLEEFGDEAVDTINDLINEETEALAKAGEKKNAIERRRAQKESQGKLDFYYKVKDALTPQEQVETPTEEAAPVEEAPIEQPVAEIPVEEAQPEQAPEQEATEESEPIAEETIEEQPSKPTEKEDSEFQKRIAAVGEPRNLEEAILMDIALGGAKFRWGNRNEDKKVLKRGIGDLWKYDNKEFRKRIGIVKKDGFSIETYAEAILAGQLQPYSGAVSQQAEGMDFQDIVAAIEDVLQMVTSKTGALQALEENRQAEAEEEQRYIRSLQDKEARDMGFEDWEDYENYQKSLEENNLTDDDYEEINRIFAEQTQEEDEQRARTSESEGDTAANQSDEQQGVRGESEGGTGVLQGTQVTDTGATEPTGQSTRSESGDTTNAAPQGEGADEVRAEIDRLKAQRASIVSQRDEIQQRYEQANGLFGDTQADENDLFGGQSFLSPELAQATIDGYNRQIKQIDEQIAKLEASLKRAEGVTQTEIEQTDEVAPEDIETAAANPAATETKVEKGLTMEEVDAAEGIDTQTKLLAKEYIKGNKNELTKDAYEEVREYYAERGRRNPEQNGGTAGGTQLAAADNEAQDQRGGGQRGVESGRVDREGSEATLPEDNGRGENGAQQPSATAGEQGVNIGNGEQLGTSGQPVDSGNTTGGSRSGGNGSDVRQPRGEKEGSGVSGTGTRGQSGTSKRRSADEIDKDIADDLAEISSLFKEFVAEQKKLGISVNPEEQAQADIAWFRSVRKAIFKLAGHVFEKGYNQFDEWKNKIKDLLHSAIKNFRDKLSDERLDQLLADAWECPFERNGEVKTIREWASELHAEEVRKMLSKSIEEKRKEQEEANKKHIKQVHGDLDNIKATLPFLLPHQQENVAKAERQFFSEEHADREHGYGKGYCFTDGTGTGKTFTGLGIARRFVNEGKGRILILTTKTKVNDWVADGAKMGLDVTSLEAGAKKAGKTPTEFKGSGIVCTTYANARQNKALLEDVFDLVIYDESHYIMNNKGGEETISTKSHYMLTNKNIENALARLQEIHPLWIKEQELVEERQAQEAIIRNDEASYATQQAAVARISQIDGQLKQIKEQQKDELPAMREKAAEAAKITKAVFLSATPFKSIDNLEYAEGYLFSYPEEDALTKGSTDHRSGKDEFKLRFFGSMYRWRHHQIEEHVQNLDAAVQQQQAFADRLMETLGTMSGQVLDNGYDYSRHFPLVEVAMADQFNSAVEAINRDPVLRVLGEYFPFDDYQKMSVLFETMKVAAMLPRIKEHLAKGRKVVIFNRRTNYPQPTPAHPNPWVPQNPFVEGLATAIATAKQSDEKKAEAIMNAVNVFQERYGSLIAWADKLDYRLPAEQLKDAFGDKIEVINGKVTGKKRQAIIDKFNRDDDQGLDLLLGQEITMREGISIHDTTGNKQRVVMSLALPQETTTFIQGEGRIYRIGNKSNAIFEYPLLGINRELQLFALSFNAAVGVTENLAMGSSARNLARSIAKGVMEDSGVVPMENQGIGGREKDYGKSTRDAYSSAINDYYSNQKQKAGRENRLGEDYYATPEPLGFKMVQWLNLAEGEEVLEPSAGHGAIARYFPNNVRSLAIEPSDALFTMLALNTGGVDKDNAAQASGKNKFVQNGTFEDLKTINKYDAIAMNPPFGHAGATAIEHLEKAWQHLRNSGRIAIIVPTGAMDKKMEKWFDEHKNAVVVGEIKLPSVTFQQAGTSVNTRMLLIDRVDRASFRQKVAAKRVMLDMTGVQNIDELFRELRDIDMPSRMIDPATKLLRHGDALRTKLVSNDIVDYKRNPQTDRRSKNMGKDMTVGEEGVSMYLSNKAKGMNYDFYYSQRANWNDIKKLRGRDFFNKNGYVYLSDLANCETLAEANEKRLMDKWNSTQENFEQAKEFAEAMTDFIRRVTGFTDEQIRDYAAGKIDLFDYTKIKDNAQLTFQDLTQRYEDMEQDPMLQALFEQVSTIAERIGMKIETFNDPYTTVMGSYNPLTNTLRINSGRWNNPSESDSAKSQTILHELIHSVTSYALNAYDKGLPMSEGLKEACRRTYEIFENVKGDYTSYYGSTQVFAPSDAPNDAKYGFANTHEMLAEMANPNFRKYLQRKGLWKKLVDGIQRILNYLGLQNLGLKFTQNMNTEQYRRWYGTDKENVETATNAGWVATNAFDELSETLDMFLDNFDAALYERRNDGIVRSNLVDREGTKEEGIEYSIRELPAPKKTGKGYKVFVLKDGQLYPPMVANPNGASTPVGYWLDADAAPIVGESKTGRQQVKAGGKGTQGGSGQLAYRPGWHLGEIPYALQFNRKDENGEKTLFPKDFVWAEVEYADDVDYQDEAESYGVTENGKYRHSYAGLPRVPVDGSYRYRTNPNPETDPWIITGAMRVNRILTPSEVDAMVREAGREPQQRQEGAVTDEQVNALNEALGLNDELYRDQQEWESGTELEITKDENGYRVDGLNNSYQNVDRLLDAWRDAHPDYIAEIRNGKLYVEKWEMPKPKTTKESRIRKASAERGWRRAHAFANDTIEKLGLQDNVIILDSTRGLKGKQKTAKGWFDPNTGKIVIVMPNHVDSQDVVKTILHEGVAHYGLRKLVGDKNMNDFLDKVFESASQEVRDRIIKLAADKYSYNFRKATEEYLAGLAEDTNFERATDRAWFAKIKTWFVEMLHKIGIDFENINEGLDNTAGLLTDNELRFLLWKSYRNLVADAESRSEIARDAMMQSQLQVGNYAPVSGETMAAEINNGNILPVSEKDSNFAQENVNDEYEERPLRSNAQLEKASRGANGSREADAGAAGELEGNPQSDRRGLRSSRQSKSEQEELIRRKAQRDGKWMTSDDIASITEDELPSGKESKVFMSKDGHHVIKLIDYSVYSKTPSDFQRDRIDLFNALFPETAYELLGYTEDENGNLRFVVKQPYISGSLLENYWLKTKGKVSYSELEPMLEKWMLENYGMRKYGLDAYENDLVRVQDLHLRNVKVDEDGRLYIIDAIPSAKDTDSDDILYRDAEPTNHIADEYNRETGANVRGVRNIKRGWEQFARGMFDDMRPLEQMQKLIAKALGRELRDSEKAYELATQLVSKTGRQIDRENLDYMVPMLQQVTSAMRSLMDSDGISREDAYKMVNDYLLAKHGLERNEWFIKQGKKDGDYAGLRGLAESLGENPDDYKAVAERIVNEFEQQVDTKDLWKSMKALTDRMLEISYETGMIDKDTYDDLKQRHKYYVPLRGFADGTASDLFDYVSQSPHYQNIMKTAKGRKSMADDPLGNLMNMLQSAIVIGNQNQVMQKIYNLAVNGKSDLLRISKPWYVYNDTTDTWEEKFPDIPEDASADEIDTIMKKFDADMQQLKAQGKAKQRSNRLDVGKKILPAEVREHRMIAYINGQKVAMHVAGNPLVAQAMNRMNTQHLNKVMQGIQTATRWYSSINTSWSPAFGPKNALRDIRFMLFSSFVTGGFKKQMQTLGNIMKATWVLPRLIVTGKMEKGITKMLNPNDAAQLEQWWNEFLDNGGETGFTRTLNAEKAKAEVKDMVRYMLNGSKEGENRVRKYTLGLLEELGRYSEDISRFAAFCQQRAQGKSVLSSIDEAKNVTVNFNVHGGSDLAANMRALYSFFNASMQGINRMRRLATEHPKRFFSGIATLMLGGAVLPWLNMAMFALLGGDDDDWRKYEELTEYTANHNMILYVGNGKFLSIPWSQELAPWNALGNIWFRQQMGWNKGKSVAEQWGDMLVDLSPVSVTSGKKPGVGLVKTIMPSFTTPVWEAIFNEDFTGSPLYKDNQWNKYDAAWEKAYEGKTSKSVIDASKWLDEKTGVDINPAIAEHLFSGVLGGIGRSGDKLLRYFTNGFQLQDAPFIRTMMFDSNPRGYIGAVQREYGRLSYDVLPKVKHDVDDMTATELASFTQTEEYEIANTVSKYKTGKDLSGKKTSYQSIDEMEKEYKKIAGKSDGSEEYREQLEQLRLQITERKMELLDEIEQIKYEHAGDLRKRIIDYVNEVERESKEKAERKKTNNNQ